MPTLRPLSAFLLAGCLLASSHSFAANAAPADWTSILNPSDQQRLASVDSRLKPLLDEHQQSEDEQTRNEALNLYRIVLEEPEPLSESALVGTWRCRSAQLDAEFFYAYPDFKCVVRTTPQGLFLEKTSGSQRISGYLMRQDDSHYVFAGGASVNAEPQVSYSGLAGALPRESDVVGLLRSAPDGFVVLIPEQNQSFNVLRFRH